MTPLISLFTACYRWLLRLYPAPFRREFGQEMEIVFQDQLAAAGHSRRLLLQIGWRELRDWPLHCFQAHWQLRQERLQAQAIAVPSWWETAASGFPYFLFALFLSGSTLYFFYGRASGLLFAFMTGYGFIFILLLALIAAWWRGWPVWSATWLSLFFYALLVLFLPGQLPNLLSGGAPSRLAQILVGELAFPLLWLVVLYLLLGRWPRAGLVAMLPTFGVTWLMYLEFVPETLKTTVLAATWIWLGVVAILLLRQRHPGWDIWLLYLAGGVVGLMYVYAGHFWTEVPVRDGRLGRMAEDLFSDLLPALIPLVGVLLLHSLRQWQRQHRPAAGGGYRWLLGGLLGLLIGVQLTVRLGLSQGALFIGRPAVAVGLAVLCLAGLGLMAVGLRPLLDHDPHVPSAIRRALWLLFGLLLLLPLLFDLRWPAALTQQAMYQGSGQPPFDPQVIENAVFWLRQSSYAAGLAWLLLAAWVIGRLRRQLPSRPAPAEEAVDPRPAVSSVPPGSGPGASRREKISLAAALLLLVALLLPPTRLAVLFPNDQAQPFATGTSGPLFLVMTAGLILAALPLAAGFRRQQAQAGRLALGYFSLAFLLLAAALFQFYRLAVWDNTYDGLGYLWLMLPITGLFFAAAWLAIRLPASARLAAFFYLLLLVPLLIALSRRAQGVDFYRLTETRAERVSQALAAYYAREQQYPAELGQLTPRYLLTLSEPLIIFGQDWCYDGRGQDYQLGYVYREHWSDPRLAGYSYSASAGAGARLPPICAQELSALLARAPDYYERRQE